MTNLGKTMQWARRNAPAAPAPLPLPAATLPAFDGLDGDVGARLEALDLDQLGHVADALGRYVDRDDEGALRQSIADYVEEWADDVVEDREDEDPEAARAAGRQEALGFIEEEILGASIDGDAMPKQD